MGHWSISDTINSFIFKSIDFYKNVREHTVLNHGPIRLQPIALPHRCELYIVGQYSMCKQSTLLSVRYGKMNAM